MNLLAELSSAGAPATVPAVGGGRAGGASAPAPAAAAAPAPAAATNPFADVLGTVHSVHAAPAEPGTGATGRAAAGPELTTTNGQPSDTADGGNAEPADVLAAALLLLAQGDTPPAVAGSGPVPQGTASRLAALTGSPANGNPLPPAVPHSGNPLPPQAGAELIPASPGDLRGGILAALRLDGTQSLTAAAGAGIALENSAAQRMPAGSERLGEAGNLLRNLAGAENLPDVAVTVRSAALRPAEGAVAVFDPRAMLEANARQHRPASAQAAALETLDRTASGLESAEPANRPLVARSVPPTLLARDMSALAERVETLAQRPGSVASVSVSLGDLGSVEISVRMEARQAHVQFFVQDAMAREALESQLPRLRAMLEESGLKLGDVNTGLPGKSERDADGGQRSGQTDAPTAVSDDREVPADNMPAPTVPAPSRHLLDAFA